MFIPLVFRKKQRPTHASSAAYQYDAWQVLLSGKVSSPFKTHSITRFLRKVTACDRSPLLSSLSIFIIQSCRCGPNVTSVTSKDKLEPPRIIGVPRGSLNRDVYSMLKEGSDIFELLDPLGPKTPILHPKNPRSELSVSS